MAPGLRPALSGWPPRGPEPPPGSPYEHPLDPPLRRYAAGDHVEHHHGDAARSDRVVRTLDHAGLVEVDFGREGTALVGVEELEPEGA